MLNYLRDIYPEASFSIIFTLFLTYVYFFQFIYLIPFQFKCCGATGGIADWGESYWKNETAGAETVSKLFS